MNTNLHEIIFKPSQTLHDINTGKHEFILDKHGTQMPVKRGMQVKIHDIVHLDKINSNEIKPTHFVWIYIGEGKLKAKENTRNHYDKKGIIFDSLKEPSNHLRIIKT